MLASQDITFSDGHLPSIAFLKIHCKIETIELFDETTTLLFDVQLFSRTLTRLKSSCLGDVSKCHRDENGDFIGVPPVFGRAIELWLAADLRTVGATDSYF